MSKKTKKMNYPLLVVGLFMSSIIILAMNIEIALVLADTEPNNSFEQANEISDSGITISGHVRWQNGADIWDYYKLSCKGGTTISVTGSGGTEMETFCLEIYDPNYDKIDSFEGMGLVSGSVSCTEDGWYYIRVSCDGLGTVSYSFVPVFTKYTAPPELGWISPENNALITFQPSSNSFSFTYSASNFDYVRLYIGPTGSIPTTQFGGDYTDEGTSISKTVDIGEHMNELQGLVRADLRGYVGGSVVKTVTRTFNFSKIITIESELLEEGQKELGSKLMLILYDPPGDQSFSSWTSETKVRIKNSIEFNIGVQIEGQIGVELFNSESTTKTTIDLNGGPDFAWENVFTDIEELTSSINDENRELVGPGYGDIYYGEFQILLWEVCATKTTYANGVTEYTNPYIRYGIDYSDHALVSRENAPPSWLNQNPNINTDLYNDPDIISWQESNSILEGGTGYREVTHEESNSYEWGINFEFTISHSTAVKIGGTGTKVTGHFTFKYDYDHEETNSIKTLFHIQDDDEEDYFHYDVGVDKRFGVPIFRNTPTENPLLQSKSSNPWEHNTRDVISPETSYPVITYNTDGDSYSPSEGDTPLVELTITDEADIGTALLIYSADGGNYWNTITMQERINNPNVWYANIYSHEHGTEILWYIFTQDSNGNSKTVLDMDNNYFRYTVINRPCEVTLLSPNGGETYNESILIEWSGADPDNDLLTYSIGYQTSGGSWTEIVSGLTNTSYLWDISQIADSDTVRVIIYADDGYGSTVSDESNFNFKIDNIDIPEVTLLAPQASFTYQGIVSISWSIEDPDDYITGFSIYYSTATDTQTWILIDETIGPEKITFDWVTNNSIVYSTNTRLKIVAQNALAETVEAISGIFTIDNRPSMTLNLINPNGGEIITTSCLISWNLHLGDPAIIYQIKLEYSVNNSEWITIDSGLTGTSYEWNTTGLPTGPNYRVRITLTATYLGFELDPITDISESTFAIIGSSNSLTVPTSLPLFITIIALFSLATVPLAKIKKHCQK